MWNSCAFLVVVSLRSSSVLRDVNSFDQTGVWKLNVKLPNVVVCWTGTPSSGALWSLSLSNFLHQWNAFTPHVPPCQTGFVPLNHAFNFLSSSLAVYSVAVSPNGLYCNLFFLRGVEWLTSSAYAIVIVGCEWCRNCLHKWTCYLTMLW